MAVLAGLQRVLPSSDVVRYEHRGCGDTSKQQYLTDPKISENNIQKISFYFEDLHTKLRGFHLFLSLPLTHFHHLKARCERRRIAPKPNCEKVCSQSWNHFYLSLHCPRPQKLSGRCKQTHWPAYPKPTGRPVKTNQARIGDAFHR